MNNGSKVAPYDRVMRRTVRVGDCLEFIGSRDYNGYGKLSNPEGKTPLKAHRVIWEYHNGPIPSTTFVLHACDNPSCVSIDHLSIGSPADNVADMMAKGRHAHQIQTTCPQGHPYDMTEQSSGARRCRQCKNAASKRYRKRLRDNR